MGPQGMPGPQGYSGDEVGVVMTNFRHSVNYGAG